MQSYNKFFKFASVRVFFRKKIEFILLFYARRWLWMLAYGRHLGAYFFLLAFFLSSFYLAFLPAHVFFLSSFYLAFFLFSSFLLAFFFFLLSRVSSCPRSLFLPARVLFFFLLAFFLSSFYLAFLPARIHFSQQIPLQNLHISKICCTFALKFKYTSTRLVEY